MMDFRKLMRSSDCSSLCLDDEEDVNILQKRIEDYIDYGLLAIKKQKEGDNLTDLDIESAQLVLHFLCHCGAVLHEDMLSYWASHKYSSFEGYRFAKELDKGKFPDEARKEK